MKHKLTIIVATLVLTQVCYADAGHTQGGSTGLALSFDALLIDNKVNPWQPNRQYDRSNEPVNSNYLILKRSNISIQKVVDRIWESSIVGQTFSVPAIFDFSINKFQENGFRYKGIPPPAA